MRPLEITLVGTWLALIAAIWFRRRRRGAPANLAARVIALLSVAAMALQLTTEGYRWQMLPAYGLTVALAVIGRRPTGASRRWRRIGVAILALSLLVAIALPLLLPVPRLPEPDGPFAVGTFTTPLVDPRRPEPYGESPSGRREVMLQVWYPAQPLDEGTPAPYIADLEVAIPLIADRIGAPPFLLESINQAETHAYREAAVAPAAPFPVLVFVHGLGGIRMQNTFQVERLASHGYVVAALDHTYAAAVTIFPDGRAALYNPAVLEGPAVTAGRALIDVWSADVTLALDYLAGQNGRAGTLLAGQLALDQIGIFGHSTGGGTAVHFCARDERCRAGIGLDAWVAPLPEETRLDAPFLFLSSEQWLGPENRARGRALVSESQATAVDVTVTNTAHFDYSDLPRLTPLLPLLGLTGPRGVEAQEIVNAYTLAFFDRYIRGLPAPALDASLTPSAGVIVHRHTPDP